MKPTLSHAAIINAAGLFWLYRFEGVNLEFAVQNPRWGIDGDDGGTWHVPEYDGLYAVEGEKMRRLTDEEEDEYIEVLRQSIREELSST